MKIIELTAENFKRLKAVDITPSEHLQVIGGRNAQGKTSVLDAIWAALGGRPAARGVSKPIREGENQASVRLNLGDLIVERKWKSDKSTLVVTAADGAKYASPQAILDSLIGRLSFDPLEFTRLSAREQVSALLELVDIDIDLAAMVAQRQSLYEERTQIGRDGKALGDPPAVKDDLPIDEHSPSALIAQIRELQDANRDVTNAANTVTLLTGRIAELERDLESARLKLAGVKEVASRPLADVDSLETQLTEIEQTNAEIRENNRRRDTLAQIATKRAEYDAITAKINSLDDARMKALAAATFPVPGLAFDDDGVTFGGVPFSQASSAEQIRISLAMAMALNPKLKVIRILDGSLLDDESMSLIADMAKDADYQVLIERVGNADDGAVVIEDGQVSS